MTAKVDTTLFAFVLMPFSKEFDDTYKLGIKEAARSIPGMRVERLDEQMFEEGMVDRIYRQIDAADVIIADLSDRNPNVFYELGYADAKAKLAILLTKNADDIPFDLKHRRHVVYPNLSQLRDELETNLKWAAGRVLETKKTGLKVTMATPNGSLERTHFESTASVSFKMDIHNAGQLPIDITAIYLEMSDWQLTQGGIECPRRALTTQKGKHEFKLAGLPHALEPGGWDQVRWQGKKVVASIFRGEELKDSQTFTGLIRVRIVTKLSTFEDEFTVKLTVHEFPF